MADLFRTVVSPKGGGGRTAQFFSICSRSRVSAVGQAPPYDNGFTYRVAGLVYVSVAGWVLTHRPKTTSAAAMLNPTPGTHEKGIRLFHGSPRPSPVGEGAERQDFARLLPQSRSRGGTSPTLRLHTG